MACIVILEQICSYVHVHKYILVFQQREVTKMKIIRLNVKALYKRYRQANTLPESHPVVSNMSTVMRGEEGVE